jgi:hypothetical protein
VLTDGKDEGSVLLQDDCIDYAVDENIPIFTAAFGSPESIINQPVARIAFLTGGDYFYAETPDVLLELYSTISERLKSQYVIQFRSILPADGQWHQLRVDVLDKNYIGFGSRSFHLSPVPSWFKWYHLVAGFIFITALITFIILWMSKKRNKESGGIGPVTLGNVNLSAQPDLARPRVEDNFVETANARQSKTVVMKRDITAYVSAPAKLIAKLANGQGWVYRLDKQTTTVGSEPDNELQLQGSQISPHHAVIEFENSRYTLRDLKSERGVVVNNKKVKNKILENGDIIEIGEIILKFEI